MFRTQKDQPAVRIDSQKILELLNSLNFSTQACLKLGPRTACCDNVVAVEPARGVNQQTPSMPQC